MSELNRIRGIASSTRQERRGMTPADRFASLRDRVEGVEAPEDTEEEAAPEDEVTDKAVYRAMEKETALQSRADMLKSRRDAYRQRLVLYEMQGVDLLKRQDAEEQLKKVEEELKKLAA